MNYKNYKYFHASSKSGVPEQRPEITSSITNLNNLGTTTTRRGNSISTMNFPNLNNINNFNNVAIKSNEIKATKISQVVINGSANRTNLRKDVIKLYEKNLKKTKNEASTPNSKSTLKLFNKLGPVPFKASSFNLFQSKEINSKMKVQVQVKSPSILAESTSRSPLNKPNRTTEMIMQTKSGNEMTSNSTNTNISTKANLMQSSSNSKSNINNLTSNSNNMNIYNELAKKLKGNKSIFSNKGYFTTNSTEKSKNEVSNLKNSINNSTNLKIIKSYNHHQSYSTNPELKSSHNINANSAVNSAMTTASKINPMKEFTKDKTTLGMTKTTKDISSTSANTSSTLRMMRESYSKFSAVSNDIEGPEELHLFYVNIYQNNKKLVYKFEGSNAKSIDMNNDF